MPNGTKARQSRFFNLNKVGYVSNDLSLPIMD